jgi:hypothetical protein
VRRRKTALDRTTTVDMNSFATVIFKPPRDRFKEHPGALPPRLATAWQQTHLAAANALFSLVLFYCTGTLAAPCSSQGKA